MLRCQVQDNFLYKKSRKGLKLAKIEDLSKRLVYKLNLYYLSKNV